MLEMFVVGILTAAVSSTIEFVLGETKKVKANSVAKLIFNGAKRLIGKK